MASQSAAAVSLSGGSALIDLTATTATLPDAADQLHIQPTTYQTIHYESPSTSTTNFGDEVVALTSALPDVSPSLVGESTAIQQLLLLHSEAHTHITFLYTYRSIGRTLPNLTNDEPEELKHAVNQASFEVLRYQITNLLALKAYVDKAIKTLALLSYLPIRTEQQKQPVCLPVLDELLVLVDSFILLDILRDHKTSLRNDFSRYRRTFTSVRHALPAEEANSYERDIDTIQMFLNNPQQPHGTILWMVKQELQRIDNGTVLLALLMNRCMERIAQQLYSTHTEHHQLHRAIPFLMYLLDGLQGINLFRNSSKIKPSIDVDRASKLLRNVPVIPLYAEMQLQMIEVLKRCSNFTSEVEQTVQTKQPSKVLAFYDLRSYRSVYRSQYKSITTSLQSAINNIPSHSTASSSKQQYQQFAHRAYRTVYDALQTLLQWHIHYDLFFAWKYAHPVDDTTYTQRLQSSGSTNKPTDASTDYQKALRYNLTNDELSVILETIVNIKAASDLIRRNLHQLLPLIQCSIYTTLQQFLQSDTCVKPLKKLLAAKKVSKQSETRQLIQQYRYAIGDWQQRKNDDLVSDNPAAQADVPSSTAAPSLAQIHLFSRLLNHTYNERAGGMQSGMFSDKDLSKQEIAEYAALHTRCQSELPAMMTLPATLEQLSSLPTAWYREFYLELSKSIQFPIQLSLPWILLETLVVNPKSQNTHISHLLHCFELYNDAANWALQHLRCGYLFDEIEAECNLSFDQMFFYLSEQLYQHYKTAASTILVDKSYEQQYVEKTAELEQLMSKMASSGGTMLSTRRSRKKSKRLASDATFDVNKYRAILQQHSITILDRQVSLTQLLVDKLNVMLRNNLNIIIRKFESSALSGIIEYEWQLQNIQQTYKLLVSHGLPLDSFDQMYAEANEDTNTGIIKGRVVLHVIQELADDVVPHFIYNAATERFVRALHHQGSQPDRLRVSSMTQQWQYYGGNGYDKLHDKLAAPYRSYIGSEHFSALLRVLSPADVILIAHELRTVLTAKVVNEVGAYSVELIDALPGIKLPKSAHGVSAAHMAIELKLKHISQYEALRQSKDAESNIVRYTQGVFPHLTQAGNLLILLQQLDAHLALYNVTRNTLVAPLLGVNASAWRSNDNQPLPVKLFRNRDDNVASTAKLEFDIEAYKSQYESNPQSMFAGVLKNLEHVISQYLHPAWTGSSDSNTPLSAIEIEQPRTISRLMSALQFLFCQPTDSTKQQSDSSLYGDGWHVALCTFVHLTKQQAMFQQLDFSYHLLRLNTVQPLQPSGFSDDAGSRRTSRKNFQAPTEAEKHELSVLEFLQTARQVKQRNEELFTMLNSYYEVASPLDTVNQADLKVPTLAEVLASQQSSAQRQPVVSRAVSLQSNYHDPKYAAAGKESHYDEKQASPVSPPSAAIQRIHISTTAGGTTGQNTPNATTTKDFGLELFE